MTVDTNRAIAAIEILRLTLAEQAAALAADTERTGDDLEAYLTRAAA